MEQQNNSNQSNQNNTQAGQAKESAPKNNDVEDNKLFALLSYLGILFLIPLLAKKDSPYAQFHAKQGMVLFITGFIASFVIWIPFIGWLIGLGILVFMIMGIVNALSGKKKKLPLIGNFADKINI